ncbi:hypothetical protein D0812_05415 [Vibrio owensii]|uniref:Uncharacterized protein n=4 Tax=Vibrio TaxID=662 RepID=U2ZL20_VIBPR|nr:MULTISPECIES: hypothetical protein [Vibrio]MBE3773039.1 hypothetical protein [Vibrio parahaemolyticus]CAH1532987.1 conserved hypothetical protein [Vibrio jasicida]AYO13884.1 hypothetical protein D0812_05415 [Vibrio owensii]MDF4339400.1 hypothetical protein [Vibrio parahaemolyticus]QXO15719.1 hypothetical protein KNV97_04715 [Vibrio ostreae]
MHQAHWRYWSKIYKNKTGRSLERWALQHLHGKRLLAYLAKKIAKQHQVAGGVEVSSIWIDGTPQAHGIANTQKVKCELADLLYIVEECNAKGVVFSKKALLLQAKNTSKFKKIDSGASTAKERKLLEKLDRHQPLTIRAGVQNSSRVIGSYTLGGTNIEGLPDCSKFLLMPKNQLWIKNTNKLFPFHVTWPKHKTTSEMVTGCDLVQAAIDMAGNGSLGKDVVDPKICEWSKLVTDLENGYKNVVMNGYRNQKRVYRSGVQLFCSNFNSTLQSSGDYTYHDEEHLPYISILKVRFFNMRLD